MFNLVGKVASVVFLVAVIAAGIVVGVSLLRSDGDGSRLDTYRYILAERVSSKAADLIRESTQAEKICLLPVGGDETRRVSRILEDQIRELGLFRLVDSGAVEDALEAIRPDGDDTPLKMTEALEIGKKVGAEAVVLANLETFLPPRRGEAAEIEMDLNVLDVEKAKVIQEERFREKLDRKLSLAYFSAAMNESSGWMRLLIWVALVGGAPFATHSIVRSVTRREKNASNFALLGGYTLFDLLLALFLLGFFVNGFWMGLLVFIGFLASAAYNYIACTIIYEMGK